MFAQMKSRRSVSKPCPCGGNCSCHAPRKESWQMWVAMILGLSLFVGVPTFFGYWHETHPPAMRYIEVNGQMCEIHFKEDGIHATGAPYGHDMAVCK